MQSHGFKIHQKTEKTTCAGLYLTKKPCMIAVTCFRNFSVHYFTMISTLTFSFKFKYVLFFGA